MLLTKECLLPLVGPKRNRIFLNGNGEGVDGGPVGDIPGVHLISQPAVSDRTEDDMMAFII